MINNANTGSEAEQTWLASSRAGGEQQSGRRAAEWEVHSRGGERE